MKHETGFKAREMPSYNFFEPKLENDKQRIKFAEFDLSTELRGRSRKEKENKDDLKS
jgi:hypothetical protein